ncbi:MAG TPA: LamG domain-containing protein, partial [Acidobacteriota bacterium]|nr:LamG domain-containing protein [Acidobacteriota bacterium]
MNRPVIRYRLLRSFVLIILTAVAGTGLAQPVDVLQSTGREILGYADRMSVPPGETVRFMISSRQPQYQAELVRLIHGDPDPRGPGFKAEPVDAPFAGTYPGRVQTWNPGSYIEVPHDPVLSLESSLTLAAWIYPTTPRKGVQGLITKWDAEQGGYGLFIDQEGTVSLWLSAGSGDIYRISAGVPLFSTPPYHNSFPLPGVNWYFVAAVFDASNQTVRLYQLPSSSLPGGHQPARVEVKTEATQVGSNDHPLLIAAYRSGPGPRSSPSGNFNGKIDRPVIFNRALGEDEIYSLQNGSIGSDSSELVASWDFSIDISTSIVRDASPNRLDGRAVNMPMRGVTGHNWTGKEFDFKRAPEQYGAIYFHDDDLRDAGWTADFEYRIPAGLRSAIYAVKVCTKKDEDYIPFFVPPSPNARRSPIAYLVPTFTYLAYANIGNGCSECRQAESLGLYSRHSDGSGVAYSSRLRPILDMRPKAITTWSAGGRTPRHFSADLYLTDWLEAKGFTYDVITDHDLHREGKSLLAHYRVVITGSHPEYVSEAMLDALQSYIADGGRLMYMAGNGFYWVTSLSEDAPHFIEIRRWGGTQGWEAAPGEYYHNTSGELGGLWRRRGRPPQLLVGIGFTSQGFDRNAPFQRET